MKILLTHVLDEARSPVEALVYHMKCGASCFAWDDGELEPEMDFYSERDWQKADCEPCKRAMQSETEGATALENA